MKMKVLSPAGDFESLKQAVFCGADEVYLGIKDFNARDIEGFSLDNLKNAVDFAHIYGVKVHLAVNILFADTELQKALDLVVDAYNLGVDAFIVQDIGLLSLIHNRYPNIETHASTQMGIHNLEGVLQIEKLGVRRVVLARETPLEEIRRIKDNSNVDIEYFVQGALCISFSGNCYMSSYLLGKSGNRGKCKQLCRQPYSLFDKNKLVAKGFLLSAKDFCMLEHLEELKKAGVDAIKIEGRARRPFYVGVATKLYRDAVDGKKTNSEDLRLAFNRDYTPGYFDGNGKIISQYDSHIGIEVGKVTRVNRGKRFNEIYFSSNRSLSKKSVFKLQNAQNVVTISAFDLKKVGNLYCATTTSVAEVGAKVHLISDFEKEEQMSKITKRKMVDIKIVAKCDQPICAKVKCADTNFEVLGSTLQTAKNSPTTKQEIEENFKKSEFFDANISVEIENVFILKKELNNFRRNVYEKLFEKLTQTKNPKLNKIKIQNNYKIKVFDNFSYFDENKNTKNIIYSPEIYDFKDIKQKINICKSKNCNFVLDLPNFALKNDIILLKNIVEKLQTTILVNNLYAMDFDTQKIAGAGLNIFNHQSAQYFDLPCVCAESNISTTLKMPFMTLRSCPMKEHLGANCNNCPYHNNYTYKTENGKTFKLCRKKLSTCSFYLTEKD